MEPDGDPVDLGMLRDRRRLATTAILTTLSREQVKIIPDYGDYDEPLYP
jgi:hypothetical protein